METGPSSVALLRRVDETAVLRKQGELDYEDENEDEDDWRLLRRPDHLEAVAGAAVPVRGG